MSIIGLLIFLIILGLVLYLIEALLPIDPTIKRVIHVVVVVVALLYLLQLLFNIAPGLDLRLR